MLRPRFFTTRALAAGALLTLEPEPSRHIARSLRMQPGEAICLFDGSDREARARIEAIERNVVTARIEEVYECSRESPLDLCLAIAVSRGDRVDTIVQKATELGVTSILPLISERTGVRLDEKRLDKKCGHWQRIAASACEQCGRNRLPRVEQVAPLRAVLERAAGADALRLLLHPDLGGPALPAACPAVWLLVGPEGGFTDGEVDLAARAGFTGFGLGPRILRTETAPLAAITLAQARWGDLPFGGS
ncbi:MAG: 16S rRNA (uracil(1498)-N(3))-methyltransferase [Halieaceae bacterium]|jgi:16S rRNA (uracil1498-N3)-methyltransferase|nr:16S rRNA (uracil(1498)-N(3))-methyltransferase [Halieaceae bacterium]